MKKKIKLLIVGKNSFIASNIFLKLKKKINIKKIKYSEFIRQSIESLYKFDYVLNCSLHKKYVLEKYKRKYDFDYYILNKIKNLNIKFIFLSSRKIYKPKLNILETDKIEPLDNYSKNKFITENYIKRIIPNNHLILRISNVVGMRIVNNNKSHSLFLDNFIINLKNNTILNHNNSFKDFISIKQFTDIFLKITQKKLKGIFNISLGKKVYVSEILQWLTSSCKKSFNIKDFKNNSMYNNDSFTLNNSKLTKILNISIKKNDLKIYCLSLSKKIFSKIN